MLNLLSSRYAPVVAKWLVLAPVVYVFTIMWWISEGAKYVPGLVIVSLLLMAATWPALRCSAVNDSSPLDPFLKVFWLYVFYSAFVYFFHGGSWSELRALLCFALYGQFAKRLTLPDSWRIGLLFLSSLSLSIVAFSEYLDHGGRVGGTINPIPFATVIGTLLIALYAWALFSGTNSKPKAIASLSILALLVSLMMTQTRGVLIPVLVVIIALPLLSALKQQGVRARKTVMALLVVLVAASTGLAIINSDRIARTIDEVEAVSSGDLSTSIGIRLQLWRSAIPLIADSPLVGHGDGYRDALQRLYEDGKLSGQLNRFNAAHFHNQFLDLWVKKGVLGLCIFVLTLAVAIKIFWSSGMPLWRSKGGAAIVLLLSVSALTDVPLLHVPVIFYVGFLILILAAERPRRFEFN